MATAGPNICGTGADDAAVGFITWNNPSNITADDSSYATLSTIATGQTHWIKATNFNFSLPSTTSSVDGILVEWKRKGSAAACIRDNSKKLVKGGTIQGSDLSASANWPTTEAYESFGGSSSLWGLTFTYTDINASNFGAVSQGLCLANGQTASVNCCRITVTYTVPVFICNQRILIQQAVTRAAFYSAIPLTLALGL